MNPIALLWCSNGSNSPARLPRRYGALAAVTLCIAAGFAQTPSPRNSNAPQANPVPGVAAPAPAAARSAAPAETRRSVEIIPGVPATPISGAAVRPTVRDGTGPRPETAPPPAVPEQPQPASRVTAPPPQGAPASRAAPAIGPAVPASSPVPTRAGVVVRLATLELQVALDRRAFSVGLIDGIEGDKTRVALADYRQANGFTLDQAHAELGAGNLPAMQSYEITQQDLDDVGSAPTDWVEAAKLTRMACRTLTEVLSERFHCSQRLLARRNPQVADWSAVTVGTPVTVPNTPPDRGLFPKASRLEIDCRLFRLRAFDSHGHLLASFPCSIARNRSAVPAGELRVADFAPAPVYTFNPANFPESARAQEIGRVLIIPPGPNNPVGVYWLSLSQPGYGIHGSPSPETIGSQESHGCFRLTNWDVTTLATMVDRGTPIALTGLAP